MTGPKFSFHCWSPRGSSRPPACPISHFITFLSEKFGNTHNLPYICDNLDAKRPDSLLYRIKPIVF